MAYWAKAVRFDGSNDYLTKTTALTGISDTKQVTFSGWVRFTSDTIADETAQLIVGVMGNQFGSWQINRSRFDGGNSQRIAAVQGFNTAAQEILNLNSSNDVLTVSAGWVHLLFSCDMSDPSKRHLYLNDISDLAAVSPYENEEFDFTTRTNTQLGGLSDGSSKTPCDMADIWFHPGLYIDFSVTANRRKFIDASGNPVDLGSDGSIPAGFAPLIFLHGDVSTWHTNDGTGGGFTENGALVEAEGPTGYGINADEGEYTLSGQAVDIEAARKVAAAAGSYTLTGQAVTLNFGFTMGADAGVYALTGQAAGLRHAHKLAAGAGAYVLDGQDVGLESARPAEGGIYTLTGQDVLFILSRKVNRIRLTGLLERTVYLRGRLEATVRLQREV